MTDRPTSRWQSGVKEIEVDGITSWQAASYTRSGGHSVHARRSFFELLEDYPGYMTGQWNGRFDLPPLSEHAVTQWVKTGNGGWMFTLDEPGMDIP